jgi:hypothetical protein
MCTIVVPAIFIRIYSNLKLKCIHIEGDSGATPEGYEVVGSVQQACPSLTEIDTCTKLESIEIFKNEKHWSELRFYSFEGDNKVEFSKLRPLCQ